jgi:hypothetical protein
MCRTEAVRLSTALVVYVQYLQEESLSMFLTRPLACQGPRRRGYMQQLLVLRIRGPGRVNNIMKYIVRAEYLFRVMP